MTLRNYKGSLSLGYGERSPNDRPRLGWKGGGKVVERTCLFLRYYAMRSERGRPRHLLWGNLSNSKKRRPVQEKGACGFLRDARRAVKLNGGGLKGSAGDRESTTS